MQLPSAIASGIALGAIYALVAVGLNLIFGVVKIINFAQGALLTLALYAVFELHSSLGLDPYLALPAVAAVMAGLGYLVQTALVSRVLGKERTSQLLITFGLAMVISNGCLALWGADYRSVTISYGDSVLGFLGVRVTVSTAIAVIGSALAVAFLYLFLHRSRIGTAIRAVAQQPESAELAGINVRRVYAVAFAVGTGLIGVAASLMAPIYPIHPGAGDSFGIMAFIVVILGGLGSVFGAALAALAIGIIQNLFATYVSVQLSTALVFLVFIVAMIARPNGIFGRTARIA